MVVNQTKMAAVVQGRVPKLSQYSTKLDPVSKARYLEKMQLCDGIDPYTMTKKDFNPHLDVNTKNYHSRGKNRIMLTFQAKFYSLLLTTDPYNNRSHNT